jgi:2-polyprenyl-3-methyl-5-hydroxy-6-metoxy-1,4-benzoquinol methylase
MGLGPAARELYSLLDLKPPASICDLGSQEMSTGGDNNVHEGSARDWLEAQGFEYSCIDMDGKYGALKLDLNVATLMDVGRQFDIVTNHGTSEHVFDQANVFRLMHDLTKPGGLMIHAVPTPDFGAQHGFYTYDEYIFNDMAHYNGYEVVQMFRRSEPFEIILAALRRKTIEKFVTPLQGIYR